MLAWLDNVRLTLPAEVVLDLALVLGVIQDVAHGCGVPPAAPLGWDAMVVERVGDVSQALALLA